MSFTPKPSSENGCKRARPLLGTIVRVTLPFVDPSVAEPVIEQAFTEGERLQGVFSKFCPDSELNAYGRNPEHAASADFQKLLDLSSQIYEASAGAFNPYVNNDRRRLDLSGIAKGYVVDRMTQLLMDALPYESGEVNAGGDLRFFGSPPYTTHIRLGGGPHPTILRKLNSFLPAVASSSQSEAISNPDSSTAYSHKLRVQLSPWHTVTVLAESCAVADALTKVGLFSDKGWLQALAKHWQAQVLVFSPIGELQESYG